MDQELRDFERALALSRDEKEQLEAERKRGQEAMAGFLDDSVAPATPAVAIRQVRARLEEVIAQSAGHFASQFGAFSEAIYWKKPTNITP